MIIPVFKPSINRKDMDSVLSCMVSDDIGPGSVSRQFIKSVAEYLHVSGGLAFREQSKALEIAVEALDLSPGSRVLLSPLSPGYYISVLQKHGLEPIYSDVDPSTGCLDSSAYERTIEAWKPSAVLLRYPLGAMPDSRFFCSAGIPVIEDVTTVFGAGSDEEKAGSEARYCILTLEEDGIITTAGGSALLSSSRNLISTFKKQTANFERSIIMTNLNAALGIVQIKQVKTFIAKRREIQDVFLKSVMKTKHRTIPALEEGDMVPYSFPVVLTAGVQKVIRYAAKHGIHVIPAFGGCAESCYPVESCACPNAEALRLRSVLFPLYPRLSGQNVKLIAKVLSTLP